MTKYNLIAITVFFFMVCPAMSASMPIGEVTRVQLPTSINGETPHIGTLIHQGDTINTGINGRVAITFEDKTSLIVGDSSQFTIDAFVYDSADGGSVKKALFKLGEGSFRMITSKIIDLAPENFNVTTPLTSIGIRGTDFWGGYLSPIEFDILMLKGKGVIIKSMGGTTVLEAAGQGVTIPDPTRHPEGFAKALTPPEVKQWGEAKVSRANATVSFK